MAKGCSTYVDALTAIEAFRREVKKVCEGAYLRHAKRLLEVMGLDPEECELYDYADDLEDRLAELGVCRSAQSGQYFYIYLQWSEAAEDAAPEIKAFVCLEVYPRKVRDEILGKIQRKKPDCHLKQDVGNGYTLSLEAPVNTCEPTSVAQVFDNLLSEWIDYCESIDGLKLKKRQAQ